MKNKQSTELTIAHKDEIIIMTIYRGIKKIIGNIIDFTNNCSIQIIFASLSIAPVILSIQLPKIDSRHAVYTLTFLLFCPMAFKFPFMNVL